MKNLFEIETYTGIIDRLNNLQEKTEPRWGVMDAAQMLAHCTAAFRVPLSEEKLPRMFLGRLIGGFFKAKLYNDDPWKRNLPTSPDFKIKDKRDFNAEKRKLIDLVHKFYTAGPTGITKYPHPFFGKFTPEQWGKSMYKHLDHHLTQFGA